MRCETCREIEERDEVLPPCKTGYGCWIKPLPDGLEEVLEVWSVMNRLREIGGADAVLRARPLSLWGLELLGVVEAEAMRKDGPDGR